MKTITKKEFLQNQDFYLKQIKKGKIFVYPTDTIYGIGCIATNSKSIKKIRKIKQRDKKPFSIIVPNKKYIKENCKVNSKHNKYLKKLPGKYTLIFKLKNPNAIAKKELIGDLETLGIRIPNNWFARFIRKHQIPFVATSVNITKKSYITNPREISTKLANKIDYAIDDGILNKNPSKIIDLTKDKIKILR